MKKIYLLVFISLNLSIKGNAWSMCFDGTTSSFVSESGNSMTINVTASSFAAANIVFGIETGATPPASCSGASSTQTFALSTNPDNYTLTGLTPGTQYSILVCMDVLDSGPCLSTITQTTSSSGPPDPSSLNTSNPTASSIDLSWTSGGGTTNDFVIAYQTGATPPGDCSSGTVATAAGNTTTINSLTANTQYSFRVCARDASLNLSSGSITSNDITLSSNPSSVSGAVSGYDRITLSWSDLGDESSYIISYQSGPIAPANCSLGTTAAVAQNQVFRLITGLSASTQYSFRLCSVNSSGDHSLGTTTTMTTSAMVPGTIAFSSANYSVNENGTSATITVTRTAGSDGAITVDLDTGNISALAGSDYTSIVSQTISFADGDSADKNINITITDDSLAEGLEQFSASLSNLSAGVLGTATTTIAINDDESMGTFQFMKDSYIAYESMGIAKITIERVGGTDGAVSFDIVASNGTCDVSTDLVSTTTSVSFADQEMTKIVPITLVSNADNALSEICYLSLQNASGPPVISSDSDALAGRVSSSLTINDSIQSCENEACSGNHCAYLFHLSEEGEESLVCSADVNGSNEFSFIAEQAPAKGIFKVLIINKLSPSYSRQLILHSSDKNTSNVVVNPKTTLMGSSLEQRHLATPLSASQLEDFSDYYSNIIETDLLNSISTASQNSGNGAINDISAISDEILNRAAHDPTFGNYLKIYLSDPDTNLPGANSVNIETYLSPLFP